MRSVSGTDAWRDGHGSCSHSWRERGCDVWPADHRRVCEMARGSPVPPEICGGRVEALRTPGEGLSGLNGVGCVRRFSNRPGALKKSERKPCAPRGICVMASGSPVHPEGSV